MQYVVAQMEPIPFLRSSINLPAYLGEAFNWSTASLDIGAGGACGERAVEKNSAMIDWIKVNLARFLLFLCLVRGRQKQHEATREGRSSEMMADLQ